MDSRNNDNRKKRNAVDYTTMLYGKTPPQAKEIETAIIGVLMLEAGAIHDVRNVLKPEDFYIDAHKMIYRAICEMDDAGLKCDIFSVTDFLRQRDELELAGGAFYITVCTNHVVSGANVLQHSRIIKQYSVARKLIQFSGQVISEAYDNSDPLQLLRDAEQLFFQINTEIEQTRVVTTDSIAWRLVQKILLPDNLTTEERELKYLYTMIPEWDRINGPLFNGGVYVIAARPAMGKTAHIIQLLVNMARRWPVGLINVEMTDEQLAKRVISNISEFDNYIFKKKPEDWNEDERKHFYAGTQDFVSLQLHIESQITDIDRIVQKIKFWVKKFGVRAVAIDYLQILKVADELAKYMTEVQALNYILERIRSCAKEMDIPIFLLSQLNREMYRRAGNKEPNLADLKGSGKIEEIAFQISFLHRPEYYDKSAVVDEMGESVKGLCYQIIEKHRDGITDRIKYKFLPQFTKFTEWESGITAYQPIVKDMPF